LPLGLCPGPSQPKDLDSFLIPFLEELKLLEIGVPAYDGHTQTTFTLKAHVVLITGDTPAVSKLFHLSGHNAKHPCRACKIKGSPFQISFEKKNKQIGHTTQYYFPLPQDTIAVKRGISSINLDKLPHRTHDEYQADGEAVQNGIANPIDSGVKGISPFITLKTISFPHSVPFDVMHLVYIGFVRDLCGLLNGTFFKEKKLDFSMSDEMMSIKEWEQLGIDMDGIGAPVSWGRFPRNIAKYIKGFKAEELQNFLLHYLLPLSFKRVNATTYRALQRLVLTMSLAVSMELTHGEIDEIENHLTLFVKWYYDTFYQHNANLLPVCKYTVHCLLHSVQDVRNWGPASYFWQYSHCGRYLLYFMCLSLGTVLRYTHRTL
jgi:Transposase family tnp2